MLAGKVNMFFLEKLRKGLKCYSYDVVDVLNIFYHLKMTSDTETVKNSMKIYDFLNLKAMHHDMIVIQVLDKVYNVSFLASDLYTLNNI